MKTGYTHISIILDRTGSMKNIKDDTIGGFNCFLKEQKGLPGKATLTLVQFDSKEPYEIIHHMKPVREVPELDEKTFVPRANTPLLDAIGRGICDLEYCLGDIEKNALPDIIVIVIITDGHENSSREFTKAQIAGMIEEKKLKNWQFLFLGADMESIGDAVEYGFSRDRTMAFPKTNEGTRAAWRGITSILNHFRLDGKTRKINRN